MVKRKLNRKEREEVKKIFKDQREAGRCEIVKNLRAKRKELTAHIDAELKPYKEKVELLEKQKNDILEENCLTDFDASRSSYCRNNDLHPDLVAYDEETNRLLVELLTEETITVDVKAVLTKALED